MRTYQILQSVNGSGVTFCIMLIREDADIIQYINWMPGKGSLRISGDTFFIKHPSRNIPKFRLSETFGMDNSSVANLTAELNNVLYWCCPSGGGTTYTGISPIDINGSNQIFLINGSNFGDLIYWDDSAGGEWVVGPRYQYVSFNWPNQGAINVLGTDPNFQDANNITTPRITIPEILQTDGGANFLQASFEVRAYKTVDTDTWDIGIVFLNGSDLPQGTAGPDAEIINAFPTVTNALQNAAKTWVNFPAGLGGHNTYIISARRTAGTGSLNISGAAITLRKI